MTYFEDMSEYSYLGSDHLVPELGVERSRTVNVGWLDEDHPFAKGAATSSFEQALCFHLRMRVRATKGLHRCGLCGIGATRQGAELGQTERWRDVDYLLGAAEIQVPMPGGRWLIAPDLIVHYVLRHGYRPPAVFIRAVERYAIEHDGRCERIAEYLGLLPDKVKSYVRRPLGTEALAYLSDWPTHEAWTNVLRLANGVVLLDQYEGLTLWGRQQYDEAKNAGGVAQCKAHGLMPICGEWPRVAGILICDGSVAFVDFESTPGESQELLATSLQKYVRKIVHAWEHDGALTGDEGRWQLTGAR